MKLYLSVNDLLRFFLLVGGKDVYACWIICLEVGASSISLDNAVLEAFIPFGVVFLLSKFYIFTHNV